MIFFLSRSIIILLFLFSTSCRLDKPTPVAPGPMRTVRVQIEQERIEEGQEPLMIKGYPNDLYAVQVYKGSVSKYAYGVFNSIDNLELELPGGSAYRIEVTMVGDGVTVIAKDDETGGYLEPFKLNGVNGGGVISPNNQFTYVKNIALLQLDAGQATMIQEGGAAATFDRAPVSRFYGLVDQFNPDENTSVTVRLKWVVFGLTVIPEQFTDGRIEIQIEGAPSLTLTPANPTAVTRKIFTLGHSSLEDRNRDWRADDYSENVAMTITWYKSDGTSVVLREGATTKTTFQRRTEKTIRLRLGNGNMSITTEKEDLIDSPDEVLTIP